MIRLGLSILPRLLLAWIVFFTVAELILWGAEKEDARGGLRAVGLLSEWMFEPAPSVSKGEIRLDETSDRTWSDLLIRATLSSLGVTGLAVLTSVAFGPVFGVLVARFRRVPGIRILLVPFLVAGWIPGFWIACVVTGWLVLHWGHPDSLGGAYAEAGPVQWEPWWRMTLVAIPTAWVGIAVQANAITEALFRRAADPEVAAAAARGGTSGQVFHRHVLDNCRAALVRSLDRSLAAMLGAQMMVEWAFGFPGLGRMLVDCGRVGETNGVMAAGIIMGTMVLLARWWGEMVVAISNRGRPLSEGWG